MKNVIAFVLISISFPSFATASPPSYSVRELGAKQFVLDINDKGQVLTWSGDDSSPTYLYDKNGNATDLVQQPSLGLACQYKKSQGPMIIGATSLNDFGEVLVNVFGPQSDGVVVSDCIVLDHDGLSFRQQVRGLNSFATGINNWHQIIGNTFDSASRVVGFGPGCDFVRSGLVITADAINDHGQIAGTSANGPELCTDGFWQILPMFSGALPPASVSSINIEGDVVGNASVQLDQDTQASHPFLYSHGVTRDLGVIARGPRGNYYAERLNNQGQVVGAAYVDSGPTTFLYQDGTMYELTLLISSGDPLRGLVQFLGGSVINNRGVIATNGMDLRTGDIHVYVLSPL